jgi:FKBP-type peptidyl-prolyl cis-trans isomerase FkpA
VRPSNTYTSRTMMLTIFRRGALIVATVAAVVGATSMSSCSSSSSAVRTYDTITTMSGLRYVDYVKGTGQKVEPGMTVMVDYAGYLLDGVLFDTSIDSVAKRHDPSGRPLTASDGAAARRTFDRGGYPFQPFEVANVGNARVIQGWNEGLTTDMFVGGHRRLIIPPDLGYGAGGQGAIPPNSTLVFDVYVRSATGGVSGGARR